MKQSSSNKWNTEFKSIKSTLTQLDMLIYLILLQLYLISFFTAITLCLSICNYPVITTFGHIGRCSAKAWLALTWLTILFFKILSLNRGLLEIFQLDFVPKDVSEQAESQTISWRLELPGNIKDVGIMRIYTTQRDYVGLAPLVMVRTISVLISVLFKIILYNKYFCF